MKQIFLIIIFSILLASDVSAQEKNGETSTGEKTTKIQEKLLKPGEVPPELKEKLKITEADKSEFKDILESSKGKIAKIWNSPCEYGKIIDVADTFCLQQAVFRYGSSYTFPEARVFASIDLVKGEFYAASFGFVRQFLVDLGKIDLSRIDKQRKEVSQMISFPIRDYDKIKKTKTESGSFEFQDLKISDKYPAEPNHTYLLYSKLYFDIGNRSRPDNWSRITIYSIQFLKQKDNIATILWKKVQQAKWEAAEEDKL